MAALNIFNHPLTGTPFGAALDLCIVLTALFILSLRLTESILAARYPGYREYQASTPALIPLPKIGSR